MAIQPPQRFELDDLAHVEREARTIYAPGATPGDVLVVQSDHSLVAAPGGGPVPFTPTSLSGLALWLDASDATTINAGSPSDDDPVSAWADKSTNGYDATEAVSGDQPIYKAAILNGKAVLRFNNPGPNLYTHPQKLALSGAGLDLLRDITGCTVAIVCQTPATDDYVFAVASGTSTDFRRLVVEPANGNWGFNVSNDDGVDAVGQVSAERQVIVTDASGNALAFQTALGFADLVAGAVNVAATNDLEALALSGGLLTTLATGVFAATPGATPDTASQAIHIGADTVPDGGGNLSGFAGDIAEIIIVQRMLNAPERRQVLEYLSDKWATL